jgi:hypothetical protein
MTSVTTAAAEINELHRLAVTHAGLAIGHAKRAGELLLQVKAQTPHGQFVQWIESNLTVTPRQCQRYMAAAQGRTLTARAIKSDTVSHLPRRQAAFEPVPECAMFTRNGDRTFIVEQSTEPDHYFIAALELTGTDDAAVACLRRPIRGDYAELALENMGMVEPSAAAWKIVRGVRVAGSLVGAP